MLQNFFHETQGLPATLYAALGEFFSVKMVVQRAIVFFVITVLNSYFYGILLTSQGSYLALVTLVLISAASAVVDSIEWSKSKYLSPMLSLPFSERLIAWSISLVGTFSILTGCIFPICLAFYLTGISTFFEVLLNMVYVTIAVAIVFLSSFIQRNKFSCLLVIASTTLACCVILSLSYNKIYVIYLMLALLFIFIILSKKTSSDEEQFARTFATRRCSSFFSRYTPTSYLAFAAFSDFHTWISMLGMAIFGTLLSLSFISKGVLIPVNAVFAVSIYPLTTLLSRDRDSYYQLIVIGSKPSLVAQYFLVLILTSFSISTLSDMFIFGMHIISFSWLIVSIVICLVGSLISTILEVYFPILLWKTEREVCVNPRKYIVTLVTMSIACLSVFF
mgnify:CR=1 FL=1